MNRKKTDEIKKKEKKNKQRKECYIYFTRAAIIWLLLISWHVLRCDLHRRIARGTRVRESVLSFHSFSHFIHDRRCVTSLVLETALEVCVCVGRQKIPMPYTRIFKFTFALIPARISIFVWNKVFIDVRHMRRRMSIVA